MKTFEKGRRWKILSLSSWSTKYKGRKTVGPRRSLATSHLATVGSRANPFSRPRRLHRRFPNKRVLGEQFAGGKHLPLSSPFSQSSCYIHSKENIHDNSNDSSSNFRTLRETRKYLRKKKKKGNDKKQPTLVTKPM